MSTSPIDVRPASPEGAAGSPGSPGSPGPAKAAAVPMAIVALVEGSELVEQVCRVEGVQARTSRKNGTTFLVGRLADASGAVDMIAFNLSGPQMDALRSAGLVRVSGVAGVHGGRLQVNASRIEPVDELPPGDHDRLFPRTRRDVDAMFADVERLLASLDHSGMRAIARAYLDDAALMDAFRSAPAATSHHHAWIGGLLEHTWELMRLAEAMLEPSDARAAGGAAGDVSGGAVAMPARLFGGLNRDLVMLSLFLHDLDKVHELAWDGEFRYTRRGNLVGHLVGGAIELERRIRDLRDDAGRPVAVPAAVVDALVHVLVSHHGRPEYGAARRPATPEAIFVAQLDDLAAKTIIGLEAAGREPAAVEEAPGQGAFTDPHWVLETRLYRPDPVSAWTDPAVGEAGAADAADASDDAAGRRSG